jgi:hypothetical protein
VHNSRSATTISLTTDGATNKNATVPMRFDIFTTSNCSSPELYGTLPASNHTVRFVTAKFGHAEKFKKQVLERRQEAIHKFDWLNEENAIGLYSVPDHWREEFPNHTQFLDNPEHESATGGGWWFWKSVVILEQLEALQEGDFLFYADNDLSQVWWPSISDLLSLLLEHPEYDWALTKFVGGVLNGDRYPGPEYVWTKEDVFVAHCGSANIDQAQLRKAFHTDQWEAGIHIIRNTPKSRQVARQWKILSMHYHAISDEPSYLSNHASFAQNRRDQSLLNMLLKCTYRAGLRHTQVPHNCGYVYDLDLVHFYFVMFPDRTDDDLDAMQKKASSIWDTLRTIEEIKSATAR